MLKTVQAIRDKAVALIKLRKKPEAESASIIDVWNHWVEKEMADGKSREDAIKAIRRKRPDVHAGYLRAVNADRPCASVHRTAGGA